MSIYVSADLEVIKEVNPRLGSYKNVVVGRSVKPKTNKDKDGICCMCWKSGDQKSVLYGTASRRIKEFGPESTSELVQCAPDGGPAKSIGVCRLSESSTVLGAEDGHLYIAADNAVQASWRTGQHLAVVQHSAAHSRQLATGGRENDLRVWDVERATDPSPEPLFAAKNVRPDELCLRRPVWVTDARFLPDGRRIAVVTAHSDVRIYDPNTSQRRPVFESRWEDSPITCMALRPGREEQLLVANSLARVAGVDLRKRGVVTGNYKKVAGSVRAMECSRNAAEPILYSVSADRFLRVHHLDTRELLSEVYLKLKPSALLVADAVRYFEEKKDDVWDSMVTVKDVKLKRKAVDAE